MMKLCIPASIRWHIICLPSAVPRSSRPVLRVSMMASGAIKEAIPLLVVGGDSEIGVALVDYLLAQGESVKSTTRRRELSGPERPYLDLAAPEASWDVPTNLHSVC